MTYEQLSFSDVVIEQAREQQFDGETFDEEQDGSRLRRQLDQVKAFMSDGAWHTPDEMEAATGFRWSSINARLRDLRKNRWGAPVFEVDHEILSQMPEAVKADNIVLRCKLVHRKTGETVADGRGSCSIKEKQGNVNTAIKIAEKRAQVDATLRVAALSDRFTQDVEDFPKEEGEEKPRTDKQANFIASLIRQKGLSPEESAEIVKKHGVEQGKLATITQAKAIIEEMLALPNAYEPTAAFAK